MKPRQRGSDTDSEVGLTPWRRRHLERAGFDPRLAERLANDRRFDLNALLHLVAHGCPPELAARILAPLDDTPDERRESGGC